MENYFSFLSYFLFCVAVWFCKNLFLCVDSGGSRPGGGGGEGGHPDPELRGELVSKKVFFGSSGLMLVEK